MQLFVHRLPVFTAFRAGNFLHTKVEVAAERRGERKLTRIAHNGQIFLSRNFLIVDGDLNAIVVRSKI